MIEKQNIASKKKRIVFLLLFLVLILLYASWPYLLVKGYEKYCVICYCLLWILFDIAISLKLIVLLALALWFMFDYILINSYNLYFVIFYCSVMLACLFSFIFIFFSKYKRIAYKILSIAGVIYLVLNLVSPASDKIAIDKCLDSGNAVWDYNERRCRTDCWQWDKMRGCLKE